MMDAREAVMDAIQTMQKVQEWMEKQEAEPIRESKNGVTWWFRCVCGRPVDYPDKYCRECGRKLKR